MIPQLVEQILEGFPDEAPYAEILESMSFIMAALIKGAPVDEQVMLATVLSDIREKVNGKVM